MTRNWMFLFALLAAVILHGGHADPTLAQKKGGGGTAMNYQIVYLDDLEGFLTSTAAYDINSYREIVGYAETTDPETGTHSYATYWLVVDGSKGVQTQAYQLPSTGYGGVTATGINDDSEIVGRGYTETENVGLYWPAPDVQPLALPPLQGDSHTDAQKINTNSIICGHSWGATGGTPVVWQAYLAAGKTPAVTNPVSLPMPDGTKSASVYAINDLDGEDICQLVGSVRTTEGEFPVRWTVASTEFGLLVAPAPESLATEGRALGINNQGDVSGMGPTSTSEWWLPTVWSGENTTILKRARNIGFTYLWDINDAGVVVGEGAYTKRGLFYSYRAAVWASPQSDMILVDSFLPNNSPFVELNSGAAVNPAGDIVGYGWTGEKRNAYLAIRR